MHFFSLFKQFKKLKKEVGRIPRKRSKYNVDQTKKGKRNRTYNGITFDSELEMKFYRDVVCVGLQDRSVKDCELQVKYELQPRFTYDEKTIRAINYVADFKITYSDGKVIVIDTKGLPDSTAKLKKKMFHYKYPDIDYRWVSYSAMDGGWIEYDELAKRRRQRKKEKGKNKK